MNKMCAANLNKNVRAEHNSLLSGTLRVHFNGLIDVQWNFTEFWIVQIEK